MPQVAEQNLSFLSKAIAHISSTLDMQESLIKTFDFLEQHFPIDAISLHQYSSDHKSLKLLFLVQKKRFDFIEILVPVPKDEIAWMEMVNDGLAERIMLGDNVEYPVTNVHGEALAPWIEHKKRQYMVAHLEGHGMPIGHLCLMGTGLKCFTNEHKEKLELLIHPFTLAMSNLLQHKRTMDFQQSLCVERQQLRSDLKLLRETSIIGKEGGLKEVMDIVHQLHGSLIPALILGETGTGKELIADVIQAISPRQDKPFVKVNCGAIPDSLVDSELFGYARGAFTGATTNHPGRFEQADGGTLFLDEIGELPLQAQVRLLRVLQSSEIQRIGSTKSVTVDVRIIAATNRNLEQMMREGHFREDLYYRLCVYPIHVPSLRQRPQDIPELIHLFLSRAADKLGVKILPEIPRDTIMHLMQYSWPGNVRQLENLVRRCLTLNPQGPLLLDRLLPQDENWYIGEQEDQNRLEKTIDARVELLLDQRLGKRQNYNDASSSNLTVYQTTEAEIKPLDETIKEAIVAVLDRTQGKINGQDGAAELLNLKPSTLRSKMRKLGITA